ncbi:lipid asymmetry maintenance protein MlaB [Streptomyces virginiae]|uniref:STAS domain-containing protein n=1 Tax=Streptomyces virginiae TaxID=1961 RepID=UPI0036B2F886
MRQALGAAAAVYEETVVDLARLTFCDSAGFSALIAVRHTARHRGTGLRWQHIPSHLQRLLRASRTRLTGTSCARAGSARSRCRRRPPQGACRQRRRGPEQPPLCRQPAQTDVTGKAPRLRPSGCRRR